MFYGKDSIENNIAPILKKLEELDAFIFEPMPSYKNGERWTDEFRIRDGHTKLADGSWVTVYKATTYLSKIQKDITDLYERYEQSQKEIQLLKRQRREMEYGLRVAEKALQNSLNMTKEMLDE